MGCVDCHTGDEASGDYGNQVAMHQNIVADPSAFGACDGCHADEAAATANSLHTNLWGEKHLIEQRGQCEFATIEDGFARDCGGCHTTCGQCHISRPNSVNGGFVSAHKFRPTPHMTEQCTACHGSRIGIDYLGEDGGGLEGNLPDVHRDLGKKCEFCHGKEEIHGDGLSDNASGHYEHRYEVKTMPRCEDCHDDDDPTNFYHNMHWGELQCQVCHSQPYKNCSNCHVEPAGVHYEIDPSVAQFKIGLNTLPEELRDYKYVVVRHIPVADNTYESWGLATLPGYLDQPTWKYSSPHNVRRFTAQTDTTGMAAGDATCATACHDSGDGTESFFLREADLYDGVNPLPDHDANFDYIVPVGTP
jgi:hypothetical protein